MIRMFTREACTDDVCVASSTDRSQSGRASRLTAAQATVLVVDDQRVILRVFSQALEHAGYRVRIADSADAALECVRTEPPDAILVDLTMPFVNGLGFLYRLREMAPPIPVAMVTGNAVTIETQDELHSLGVAVHFKPLTAAQIQGVVEKLLRVTTDGPA
ncbi:MAG TPA: response regulator [Vicinamibacterales bacterium]|nr:response regulator [Vicinamibacterales bacterium]